MSQLKRTGVGPAQRTRLLQEVGGACPFCGLEMIGSLQIHHVDRDPQNTVDENLIATCASCHEQLTRQLIPDSDVVWRKRALQHGIHPVTKEKPEMSVSNTDNRGGVIAQHIGKVEIRNQEKTSPIILPGSIGASPRHYNYVEYLIKQLTEFRQAGASFGQKRI
ncbi:MAG: HNH endonuclease, partial [Kiritimatiellaeota bacterium]|nr:HNH endonuclease [Kiritimatiellota bacterium]